jgi:2-isopropylmalate synthase
MNGQDDSPKARHVELYDTTLRDGTQGMGISLSLQDKLLIAARLDEVGIDYIEGGYPLSNPKDEAFFREVRSMKFKNARLAAFGMTRRRGLKAEDDDGMKALLGADTPVITIVGKTWDLHVTEVLRVSLDENLAMIADSVRLCRQAGRQVLYDAEHFFDGCQANPQYALKTLLAAQEAGATGIVLCDTNGGSLPARVADFVDQIKPHVSVPLGIHCHNDAGLAVANTLEAIERGCVQAQGTINGIGERCGNVDLTTVASNLALKMGCDVLRPGGLQKLTELSRYVYEVANIMPRENQPYVGSGAFAHKGGMHVHAVRRITRSYEHVDPEAIGNARHILVSELSGASNIAEKLGKKFNIENDKKAQRRLLDRLQDLENEGYMFEAAEGSFELLCRKELGLYHPLWALHRYMAVIVNKEGSIQSTEAVVRLDVGGKVEHVVAEGNGPVDALSAALWKALRGHYPVIDHIKLRDYKVRVVNSRAGTAAKVRVTIEFFDEQTGQWLNTVGVSENIIDASWRALTDALELKLLMCEDGANGGEIKGAASVSEPKP